MLNIKEPTLETICVSIDFLNQTGIILGINILLASCKRSDKYVGDWYALSDVGDQFMIHIKLMWIVNFISTYYYGKHLKWNKKRFY